jgi:hypothetical protein
MIGSVPRACAILRPARTAGQKQSSLQRQEDGGAIHVEAKLGAGKMVETGDFCGISGFAHFN